jgi:hypothetical protein
MKGVTRRVDRRMKTGDGVASPGKVVIHVLAM